MYDFNSDLQAWRKYTLRVHSRRFAKNDFYTSCLTYVEGKGHSTIARADCDRSKVLEIGTGGGEHIPYESAETLKDYTAADVRQDFLDLVKKQFPEISTHLVNGIRLPFADGSFTTCIAHAVLEHVSTLDETLAEVSRVLSSRGSFLVVVPTNGSLCVNLFKLALSYLTLRANGIARPSYIWNFENVNNLSRVRALLHKHPDIQIQRALPFRFLPAQLSPLFFFHCRKRS